MREPEPDADTGDADAEPYWADAVFGDEPLDIHQPAEYPWPCLYEHDDGTATVDEGWGEAFIELADADSIVEVRR